MKPNRIEFCVSGRYALFSDPINRMGGEKFSYQVPTYQALKGIAESIYWKPTFTWVIDEVRIMNPIRSESKGIRPLVYGGSVANTLSIYTYLTEVRYHVRAHFEWNENRPELIADRNENKHHNIAKRCVERGGRRDIFLGTRECQGYVEACEFDEGIGSYDEVPEIPIGCVFHGFTYPDENAEKKMIARFTYTTMKKGVIQFLRPEECVITRELFIGNTKEFMMDNKTLLNVSDFNYKEEFGGDEIGVVE